MRVTLYILIRIIAIYWASGINQDEERDIQIEYGITREMDSGNFRDVYFGEFITLFKDAYHAPDFKINFFMLSCNRLKSYWRASKSKNGESRLF